MSFHYQPRRQERLAERWNRAQPWYAGAPSLIAALVLSSTALAGWNTQPETIATHPTWIYTPSTTLEDSDRRGLMLVLHGCAQTHDQIKSGGNLENTAEKFGLVMAVPYVTGQDGYLLDCWDYDKKTADDHGHVKEITELALDLQSPTRNMGIDPRHVYVIGLSSGGALALKIGCKSRDVFAGIGAIAGPSVGSNQMNATAEASAIPSTNVDDAIKICKALAGSNAPSLQTQITNIAHGDMDKNGPKTPPCRSEAGQKCVASIRWSEDNIKILQGIYGAGPLAPATDIQGGKATEQSANIGDKIVLSYLILHNVGHAFPAGSGKPNDDTNGQYVAQEGANYSEYVAQWFEKNNRSDGPPNGPVITCEKPVVSRTRKSVTLECPASGPNPIKSYHVVITGPLPKDETLPNGKKLVKQYDNLADGQYTGYVDATDDQGKTSKPYAISFEIGGTKCVTASNADHRAENRAHGCYFGLFYCANGSDDYLGFYGSTTTSLQMTTPDYWTKLASCP